MVSRTTVTFRIESKYYTLYILRMLNHLRYSKTDRARVCLVIDMWPSLSGRPSERCSCCGGPKSPRLLLCVSCAKHQPGPRIAIKRLDNRLSPAITADACFMNTKHVNLSDVTPCPRRQAEVGPTHDTTSQPQHVCATGPPRGGSRDGVCWLVL